MIRRATQGCVRAAQGVVGLRGNVSKAPDGHTCFDLRPCWGAAGRALPGKPDEGAAL